jgi:hypothetical protein
MQLLIVSIACHNRCLFLKSCVDLAGTIRCGASGSEAEVSLLLHVSQQSASKDLVLCILMLSASCIVGLWRKE